MRSYPPGQHHQTPLIARVSGIARVGRTAGIRRIVERISWVGIVERISWVRIMERVAGVRGAGVGVLMARIMVSGMVTGETRRH